MLQVRDGVLHVLLGGYVVVDRVEDLGGDPLGLLTIDVGVRQGVGQRKSVGQGRLGLSAPLKPEIVTQLSHWIAFKAG